MTAIRTYAAQRCATNANDMSDSSIRTVRAPKLWKEVALILGLYAIYSFARNLHGANISIRVAERHAIDVVNAERAIHMFNERSIQEFFLQWPTLIKFFNIWYGSAHFIVTIGVLLWLFTHNTQRYRKWRNVIVFTTVFALFGYVFYPLAPPRLLPPIYGFEDTLKTIGGLWSFESGSVAKVSNQYAAMPSLHVGWALWCAFAVMPVLRHSLSRAAISIYPSITIVTIVATANHYWLDVVGGTFVFMLGYIAAFYIERLRQRLGKPTQDADSVERACEN